MQRKEAKCAKTLREAYLNAMMNNTDPHNMWNLKYVLTELLEVKVVMSSAWGKCYGIELFREWFKHFGLDLERLLGKMPRVKLISGISARGMEIDEWMKDKGITKFVIIYDRVTQRYILL